MFSLNRRQFLVASAASVAVCRERPSFAASASPKILLRSSWQVVNIGDIAHTPGVLNLLEKHIPEAEVILWASGDLTPEVKEMELRRFPRLKIVQGRIGNDGKGSTPELNSALNWCDFLLHGSGPSLVAATDVIAFHKNFRKPFGVYGITFQQASDDVREVMSQARFLFFRDSVSLAAALEAGIRAPVMEFGPDGAFAVDLRNDSAAEAFLKEQRLVPGKFVCCIPRLRFTPYWLVKKGRPKDDVRHARNEDMKEHDHAPLRDAITAVSRQTDLKVLVCPEDQTQMAVGKENLIDKLPADVLKNVVWREDFWLTDEALSTYLRSAGLFGLEMHSPIMCIGNGIPALVGRFAEQTSKGMMWKDIGLQEWLFDFDQPGDVARLTPAVLKMVQDPLHSQKLVKAAQSFVQRKQFETMAILRKSLQSER